MGHVSNKEIVMLSKQLSTLFTAQISAVKIFRMIGSDHKNEIIKNALTQIADDIADGASVAKAMAKHPKVFSSFFVNMIMAGEESGKMSQTFEYLADYMEKTYAVTSKVKGALIYPSFIIVVFFIVMYLMLTMVIPNIADMLVKGGAELPLPTKIVIGVSNFLVDYGFILIGVLVGAAYWFFHYIKTSEGKASFDRFKLSLPFLGNLYRKLFASRVAGSFDMMLKSGVSMIKTIENTSKVVDNTVFEEVLEEVKDDVRDGKAVSAALAKHDEFPKLFIQMTKVGEESGQLATILKTMADFYEKEVMAAVSAMVALLEPIIITALGGGVGLLLAAVLLPIYSITGGSAAGI